MAPKNIVPAKKLEIRQLTHPRNKAPKVLKKAVLYTAPPAIEDTADIFATFTTNADLKDGLNVLRSLGDGKYEIVSLDAVSQNAIGSAEMAKLVKSVPERQAALGIDEKRWKSAILKCDVAVRITRRDLFRFFALPLELQKLICELVVYNPKGLIFRSRAKDEPKPFAGLSFMLTCKSIYEETKGIFLQNTFHLNKSAMMQLRDHDFTKNLVVIEIEWEGRAQESSNVNKIARYPNLRVLHLKCWTGIFLYGRPLANNRLFQNVPAIKTFSKLRGFDELVRLRGLTKVTFNYYGDIEPSKRAEATRAKGDFEKFLNRELTKPKEPVVVKVKKRQPKVVVESETEDEFSEVEYVARPTKSRRGKTKAVAGSGK